MEATRGVRNTNAVPGFYIAHHRWLDAEYGPDALYKVGHTGDLRRRLTNDAYVTCFTPRTSAQSAWANQCECLGGTPDQRPGSRSCG